MALRDYWGAGVDFKTRVQCLNAKDCKYRCGHKMNHALNIRSCSRVCKSHRCVTMDELKFYEETAWMDKGMKEDIYPERVQGGFGK